MYEQEDSLDTVLFANKDGSETIYMFHEDVKYIDKDGNVADKSNKLYSQIDTRNLSSDYSYMNKDNDINTYFPTTLMTDIGVVVKAQEQVIEMYPISGAVSEVTADSDLYGVYYDDVFGEFTGIRYKPRFSGYKEDIVLEKNVGNKFGFILETGNLTPVLENGVIYIRDTNGNDFGIISPTYVYDSFTGDPSLDEECHFTYDNEFKLTRISEGKYELIVVVDEKFLNNPATVYPVIVDPTITINSTGSGSGKSILDTPIYTKAAGTAGANSLAIVGYVNSSYGSGRLLMRFPELMEKTFMKSSDYIINSASLHMNEVSGKSTNADIAAYMYMGDSSWTESSLYSDPLWYGAYGTALSSRSFSYPNSTTAYYDITKAVKLWQSNSQYRENGIIFMNKTSEKDAAYAKTFYTTEGSTQPCLRVSYSNRTKYDKAFYNAGVSNKSFTIKLVGTNANSSTWQPLIKKACDAWNDSDANTYISAIGSDNFSSGIHLEVDNYIKDEHGNAINWLGCTTSIMGLDGKWLFIIQINSYTLDALTLNAKQSTITHEIGHLLWLEDFFKINDKGESNPVPYGEYSLMDHGRDRDIIYIPQSMDAYHVKDQFSKG